MELPEWHWMNIFATVFQYANSFLKKYPQILVRKIEIKP